MTTRAVLPLLLNAPRPLVVNISFGDEGKFLGDVQYDVAKASVTRLGFALAAKLEDEGLTALTLYPGFVRTERVAAAAPEDALAQTHSPRFVGRAIVALATDEEVMTRTGKAWKVGVLAREYDFDDIDGTRPAPFTI